MSGLHGAAHSMRASFTQNLQRALMMDYTNVSDDMLARAYMQSVTAAACIEVNARMLSSVPLLVKSRHDEGLIDQHPLGGALHQSERLLWDISSSLDIWGRAYLLKHLNAHGYYSGIEFVRPTEVEPTIQTDRQGVNFISSYRIYNETFLPHQVIDIPLFDPVDPLGSFSPLEMVVIQTGISRNMAVFAANFFLNGARLAGILNIPTFSQEQAQQFGKEFNAQFSGARRAFKTHVTYGTDPPNFTAVSAPPEDLAMTELHATNETDIARAFNVDPALVGLSQTSDPLSAQSTFQAMEANHLRANTLPRLGLILYQINRQWAWRDFEPAKHFTLGPNIEAMDVLSPITTENATTTTGLWTSGELSLNETRQRLGMPSLDRDGEVVNINGVLYPIDQLAEVAQLNVKVIGAEPTPQFPSFTFSTPEQQQLPPTTVNVTQPTAPPQLPARSVTVMNAELRELANWQKVVERSTPDAGFYLVDLEGHPAAEWLRSALDAREDVDAAFWIARAWVQGGEPPPNLPSFREVKPEITGGFLVPLAGHKGIARLRDKIQKTWPVVVEIEWTDVNDWHLSLCYGISPIDFQQIEENLTGALEAYDWFGFFAMATHYEIFDTPDGQCIVARLHLSDELSQLQQFLCHLLENETITLSEYSLPENYKPHISLAYTDSTQVINWQIPTIDPLQIHIDTISLMDADEQLFQSWELENADIRAMRVDIEDAQLETDVPAIEATPEEAEEFWALHDELQADLGVDWLAFMQRIAEDNAARILSDPEDWLEKPELLTPDEQLKFDWLGTPNNPGPLTALVLNGMVAGEQAIEREISTDPRNATRQRQIGEGIVSFELLSQEAWDFVNSYYFDLIKGINNTTAEELQKIIAQWIEDGETIEVLAERLGPVFNDTKRAQAIAQTESTRAYNEGSFARYEAAGVTEAEWMTVRVGMNRLKKLPGDVCNICAPLHGVVGNIREGWVHPGGRGPENKFKGNVYRPPSHVRCRCYSRPIVVAVPVEV
jgi:HK97 family phage portal protein